MNEIQFSSFAPIRAEFRYLCGAGGYVGGRQRLTHFVIYDSREMREDGPPYPLNRDTLPQSDESSQFHGEIPIDSKRIDSVAFPLKLKKD